MADARTAARPQRTVTIAGVEYPVPPGLEHRPGRDNVKEIMAHAVERVRVERALGRALTIEHALREDHLLDDVAGESDAAHRESNANRQALQVAVPPAAQQTARLVLVELKDGVLRAASHRPVDPRDIDEVLARLAAANYAVREVDARVVDLAEYTRLLRGQAEVPAERIATLVAQLSLAPDNALNVEGLVRNLLSEALQRRASDVHLTQSGVHRECRVEYRVDGAMRLAHVLPPHVMAPLVTRLKNDAGMDSAQRYLPQDGRLAHPWQEREIDVRVATIPTDSGEKVTMRLLDTSNLRSFDVLLAPYPEVARRIKARLHTHVKEGGILFVTGPVGSGKSTTLFAAAMEINRLQRKVYSVEAPVEYKMPLVHQSQAGESGPFDMVGAVRALLRHDLDFAIIGETRDEATAEAAMRIFQSGSTVLTTLHSNGAANTFDRLESLMESNRASSLKALADYLVGVLNQRLASMPCSACRRDVAVRDALDAETAALMGLAPDAPAALAHPSGCEMCHNTGYVGRTLVLEAYFPPPGAEDRRTLYRHLLAKDTGAVLGMPGALFVSRIDSVRDLIRDRAIDARVGASLCADEIEALRARRGRGA